jgi:hypothetical protein
MDLERLQRKSKVQVSLLYMIVPHTKKIMITNLPQQQEQLINNPMLFSIQGMVQIQKEDELVHWPQANLVDYLQMFKGKMKETELWK